MGHMTKIVVERLRKEFGKLVAVDDLSLEIRDGEFVCFLGPTGCGKTTMLNCIAGLEEPTSGDIYFGDQLVNKLRPQDRKIGFVFQNFATFNLMSVYDNIAFGLKVRKVPSAEIAKEVNRVAALLRLDQLLRTKVGQLSLNEMQKVALARAIVIKPAILFLDEPLSQLDAFMRATMRAELKRLQREVGQTAVFVTHDQLEAMAMADRIAIMNRGRLQQYDTPDRIYNSPSNRFVASFLGNPPMNIVDCRYEVKGTKALLLFDGESEIDVTLFREVVEKNIAGAQAAIAIRPEHVWIRDHSVPGKGFAAEIQEVEPLGSETIVDFMFQSRVFRAVAPSGFKSKLGDTKWIELDMSHLHILDSAGKVIV